MMEKYWERSPDTAALRIDLQFFAEGEEKTEQPTPRKKKEARKKGQVARSKEIANAVVLIIGTASVFLMFPGEQFGQWVVRLWSLDPNTVASHAGLQYIVASLGDAVGSFVATFLGLIFIVAFLATVFQVGFTFSPLTMKLSHVNPLYGLKRLFSMHAVVELVKSLIKVGLLAIIGYTVIKEVFTEIAGVALVPFGDGVGYLASKGYTLAMSVAVAYIAIAAADWLYQRHAHLKQIKMTKYELKQEFKETEGDPLIRSKLRERQRMMAQQRMIHDLKTADVLITNPTHYAVALRYDLTYDVAPRVVAKGHDWFALKLKELAKGYGIKVVENKPLARALYDEVEVGDYIPESLYQAVAEILSKIESIRQRILKRR